MGSQTNLSIRILLWQITIEIQISVKSAVWFVGRSVPNDQQEGFIFLSITFDILNCFIHDNFRTLAIEFFGRATIQREDRIHLEKIIMGKPMIKAHGSRVGRG